VTSGTDGERPATATPARSPTGLVGLRAAISGTVAAIGPARAACSVPSTLSEPERFSTIGWPSAWPAATTVPIAARGGDDFSGGTGLA
jgi:hypothetical protein